MSSNLEYLMRNKVSKEMYDNFKKGIEAVTAKEYDTALEKFDEVIAMAPSYYAAYYNKGLVLKGLKREAEALDCFISAIKYGPSNDKFFCEAGDTLYELKRYKEALDYFNKALEINGRCGHAFMMMGIIHDDILGDYEKAYTYYDSCTKYDYRNYDAYMRMAILLFRKDNIEESLNNINIAININETGAANYLKGKLYFMKGDTKEAKKYLQKAKELNEELEPKVNNYLNKIEDKDAIKKKEEVKKVNVIKGDQIIKNPEIDYYKGIDYLVDMVKRDQSPKAKLRLWKEVFSIKDWYILLQPGEKKTIDMRPYWENIDGNNWFFMFTDVEHAKLCSKLIITDGRKINLVSASPEKMVRAVYQFEESGAFGVIFNQGPHRFKISLDNLYYLNKKMETS